MIGQKYYDNNQISQCYRDMDYEKHVQKVTSIVNQKPHNITNEAPRVTQKFNSRMHSVSYIPLDEIQKKQQVDRKNKQLLEKLIEIKQGKQCFLYSPAFTNSNNYDSLTARTKSLNQNYRQQREDQIAQENQAIALRILSQKPNFQRDKIQKDIGDYLQLRDHMQRYKQNDIESFQTQITKLPPLISHTPNNDLSTEKTRRDRYLKVNMSQHQIYQDNSRNYSNSKSPIKDESFNGVINQYQSNSQNLHNQSCVDILNSDISDGDNHYQYNQQISQNLKDIYEIHDVNPGSKNYRSNFEL